MKSCFVASVILGLGVFCSPAHAQDMETHIFNEETSFESYIRESQRLSRGPASNKLKFRVIAVRREIGLTEYESRMAPQDIVINGGGGEGIEHGMTLNVVRKVPIIDPYYDNQHKELEIRFATVKVIHVQEGMAIARVEKLDAVYESPAVGVRGVLIGDFLSTH
jgi:hypothetical protein